MRIMRIPRADYRAFRVDGRRFIRDVLNVSGKAEEPFVLHPDRIKKCFQSGIKNPFDETTLMFDDGWACKNPGKPRYMHIDLAQNRCGAGISCCHVSHIVDIKDRKGDIYKYPYVEFDFVGSIKAERGAEVEIQQVEDIIYELSRRKFNIALITFDRFQSVHIRQRLTNRGYVCAQMSVERCSKKVILTPPTKDNMDGYIKESTQQQILSALTCFKERAYLGLMSLPYHELALKEVIKSGLIKKKNKVVPLPGMTIDIFHSMSGAVYNLVNNTVIALGAEANNEKWKDKFYDETTNVRGTGDLRDGSDKPKIDAPDPFYGDGYYVTGDDYYNLY